MHAFPYFVNNLAPGMRAFWIHYSDRVRVDEFMRDDLVRLRPEDVVPPAPDSSRPRAVVLNPEGVLLGTIETSDGAPRALDAMNPNPQTIRPDMTLRLTSKLLSSNPYLIVTTSKAKYLGRYSPRNTCSPSLERRG
jgi:hypothetical protein